MRDPELRAKLTPTYAVGCKRLILSENFYEAIQHPNAELVTERIERMLSLCRRADTSLADSSDPWTSLRGWRG